MLETCGLPQNLIVVAAFLDAWSRRDLHRAMTYWAQDSTFTLHLSEDLLPGAGTTTGRDQIHVQLATMLEQWEYILFRPGPLRADYTEPTFIRCRHEFIYRHRATGQELSGHCRFIWRLSDGLIHSFEIFHDRGRIEAFLRLAAMSTKQPGFNS
jgi:ketosteroid isomerase-like protein